MDLSLNTQTDHITITVNANRIDAKAALGFKDAVHEILSRHPEPRVTLDLCQVDFIDSSGLGAIVAVKKHSGAARNIDLRNLTPAVDKVFKLTRMDRIFDIQNDANPAYAAQ